MAGDRSGYRQRRISRHLYKRMLTWATHTLGFRPQSPLMLLGIRTDPPRSVPQPTREPCKASNAPSPPVEPPGLKSLFLGFTVRPHRGFSVSHHYIIKLTTYNKEYSYEMTCHNALRQIRFCENHSPKTLKDGNQNSIFFSRKKSSTNITKRRINTFEVELVFQGDWHSMERSDRSLVDLVIVIERTCIFQSIFESYFGEAICLAIISTFLFSSSRY